MNIGYTQLFISAMNESNIQNERRNRSVASSRERMMICHSRRFFSRIERTGAIFHSEKIFFSSVSTNSKSTSFGVFTFAYFASTRVDMRDEKFFSVNGSAIPESVTGPVTASISSMSHWLIAMPFVTLVSPDFSMKLFAFSRLSRKRG